MPDLRQLEHIRFRCPDRVCCVSAGKDDWSDCNKLEVAVDLYFRKYLFMSDQYNDCLCFRCSSPANYFMLFHSHFAGLRHDH